MSEYTVLIVDDERNVLSALRRLFMDSGYTILTAESATEGLELFKTHDVHLVISDYRMPGMNGVEFLTHVKDEYPETIRMILSGYADVNVIVDAINDGHVYKFLAKPWNDQELLSAVRRSFEHHNLQIENNQLLIELRNANDELRSLTGNLENQVTERTQDLELKNRALQIAQSILGLLPVGVIGMDSAGMIVYVNQSLSRYIKTSGMLLGTPAEHNLPERLYGILAESVATSTQSARLYDEEPKIGLVCTPLTGGVGVIGMFFCLDVTRYQNAECGNVLAEDSHA